MKYPFVSVAVVSLNAENYIEECLDSIVNLDYPKESYEILLIDGGSTDKTLKIAKKFKKVKIYYNLHKIISSGRNLAIKKSKGKYLAFTDSDCKVDKNWLKKLVELIEISGNKVVGVGGPNLIFKRDPFLAKIIGHMQETLLGSGGSPQSYEIKNTKKVVSLANCNVIYRKDILSKNKYNTKFNIGEDAEFNYRLKKEGYEFLYSPEIIVWHHRRNTLKNFIKNMFGYGKAQAKISKLHKHLIRKYSIAPAIMVIGILFMVPLIMLNYLFFYVYLGFSTLYFIMLFLSMIYVIKKVGISGLLSLILLPLQHIFYGFGFLWGLIR